MSYYVQRLGQAVFTVWAAITVTFALTRWLPGGPLDFIRAQLLAGDLGPGGAQTTGGASQLQRFNKLAEMYVNIDPDEPLLNQYIDYVLSIMRGDFGRSITQNEPVTEILVTAVPWTVFLATISLFVSFVTLIVVGSVFAYYEGSKLDFGGTSVLIWSHAVPYYIIGILMLYVFAFQLGWFPTGGRTPSATPGLNWPFIAGVLDHAALPVLSLAWAQFGAGAIAMRANSIQVLGSDYLRAAQLRGIRTKRLTVRYIARNAVLPMYTRMLIGVGYIMGGSVIVETIFRYRGVGYYMFSAIQARDYPLLMGGFLLIALSLVTALFIADMTYGLIDPRVTKGEEAY